MKFFTYHLLSFSFLLASASVLADGFYFTHLNDKIVEYSDKIEVCDSKKVIPDLNDEELSVLRRIITKEPLVWAYLTEKTYNQCLQPERGELAELLLIYEHLDLPVATSKLASVTGELTYKQSLDALRAYESIDSSDKEFIEDMEALRKPIKALEAFEKIMGM